MDINHSAPSSIASGSDMHADPEEATNPRATIRTGGFEFADRPRPVNRPLNEHRRPARVTAYLPAEAPFAACGEPLQC